MRDQSDHFEAGDKKRTCLNTLWADIEVSLALSPILFASSQPLPSTTPAVAFTQPPRLMLRDTLCAMAL
jgi:hypothetical protein